MLRDPHHAASAALAVAVTLVLAGAPARADEPSPDLGAALDAGSGDAAGTGDAGDAAITGDAATPGDAAPAAAVVPPAPVVQAAPAPTAPPATPPPATPRGYRPPSAQIAVGPYDHYRPVGTFDWKGFRIQVPLMLNGRAEDVGNILVDRYGGVYQPGAVLSPQVRLGVRFETLRPLAGKIMLLAEYEHDLPTGFWTSSRPIDGVYMPTSAPITTQLRKGYLRVSLGRYLHAGGGFMTNHFGMGLLANDGAHGWEPGSARFIDPRNGNLVLRGFLATGPLTRAKIVGLVAFDQVRADDILLSGDSATQFVASMIAGYGGPHEGGFFLVHRWQRAADGHGLEVTAIDLAGKSTITWRRAVLTLEGEAAVIAGSTTLAPNTDFSRHQVLEVGAAARANLSFGPAGGVLDLLYASGDQNYNDGRVTAFRADHNYETGLLLFRYVEAAQSGRGAVTAANPALIGMPAQNLERVPTRGGVTNAMVFFPRFWVRPIAGLEAYGGPLFAVAPVKNLDPLNTSLSGGSPRNALNADPGSYWGTELDLGARYRLLIHGTQLTLGAEGGILFPGSALRGATGLDLGHVLGGRLMLMYRL